MEVHLDFVEPSIPAVSYSNISLWNEDSGYYTSCTPSSVDYSNVSDKNLKINFATPEPNLGEGCKFRHWNAFTSTHNEGSPTASPIARRGLKRSHQDNQVICNTVPTPTTMIAGGIQKLKVTDSYNTSQSSFSISSVQSDYSGSAVRELYQCTDYAHALSFPTTPVKKICRSSCKISPMKRSTKKLNFAIHSLSCASSGLQPLTKHRPHSKVVRTIQFRPEQKVDIIKMLHQRGAMPPLKKVFSFLSNQDICNVNLVSLQWSDIWNAVSNGKVKHDHYTYLKNVQENAENKDKGLTPKNHDINQIKALKEVHNVLNTQSMRDIPKSPPGTPRTNKFRKFTKAASLDTRLQLLCVRCTQPAKVTKESTGEEWAECTNATCSFHFCRSCNCARHPGKTCRQYDLDGPSPSKRKKDIFAVGSKKSRRNLRRLL